MTGDSYVHSDSSFLERVRLCFRNREFLLTIVLFVVFVFIWTTIVLGKFYSLHSSVFDLGFVMQRLWQVYNIHSGIFVGNVLSSAAFQFVLSPLYFFHSYQLLLVVQVIAFGSTAFPLYGITMERTRDSRTALTISAAFLFYFPSAGILWFDVHFQAFFVPLFVFAYYFYIRNRYIASTALFLISGTVRFPYMVFPFMFAFFELWQCLQTRVAFTSKRFAMNALVAVLSAVFLAFGYHYSLIPGNSPITFLPTPYWQRILLELLTFGVIMAPLLFLPLFSPRWLIMTGPFFLLGLYTGSLKYVYPGLMTEQYSSMVLPIVFIGTIETLAKFKGRKDDSRARRWFSNFPVAGHLRKVSKGRKVSIAFLILVIMVAGSIFYAPYGPVNSYVYPSYSLSKNVNFNTSNYRTLMSIVSLIPRNNPYVLFENDMPEFLPRPPPPGTVIPFLFTTFLSSNISLGDVINNSFPILPEFYHTSDHTPVDYLVVNLASSQYKLRFAQNEATLPQIMNLMFLSGKYGILAEDGSFIALARGYSAPPKLFVPLITGLYISASGDSASRLPDEYDAGLNPSPSSMILPPGRYNITCYLPAGSGSNTVKFNKIIGDSVAWNTLVSGLQQTDTVVPYVWELYVGNTLLLNQSVLLFHFHSGWSVPLYVSIVQADY